MPRRALPSSPLQLQARALGDPTRHRVFQLIAGREGGAGVSQLAAAVGLHHTVVRQHLAQLREAGLVTEETDRGGGRGRPRLRYRVDPAVRGAWDTQSPYERLARLLASAVRTGKSAREAGEAEGYREAREARAGHPAAGHPPAVAGGPIDAIEAEIAHQGFAPRRVERGGGVVEMVLERCPFAAVASADPGTVCQLHLGLAEGLARAAGGVEVATLAPRDPHRAGCRLTLRPLGDDGPLPLPLPARTPRRSRLGP